jgi:hypothetical protein
LGLILDWGVPVAEPALLFSVFSIVIAHQNHMYVVHQDEGSAFKLPPAARWSHEREMWLSSATASITLPISIPPNDYPARCPTRAAPSQHVVFNGGTIMTKSPATTAKFVLTIDKQPLVLPLDAILALFGRSRTMEFAEGKWTPYVFFQVEEPENGVATVHHIDFTDMNQAEIVDALKALPRDVVDFPGFVRDEIEKIEKAKMS